MAKRVEAIHVLGMHPIEPTQHMLDVYDLTWGTDARSRKQRAEHFDSLYLVEIEVVPHDAEVDWIKISQRVPNLPEPDWQAPWDERRIDGSPGHWAFFLHTVDLAKPLETEVGPIPLPHPTLTLAHLSNCVYELPG